MRLFKRKYEVMNVEIYGCFPGNEILDSLQDEGWEIAGPIVTAPREKSYPSATVNIPMKRKVK